MREAREIRPQLPSAGKRATGIKRGKHVCARAPNMLMSGWLDNTTAYDYFMYSLSLEPLPLLAKPRKTSKRVPKGWRMRLARQFHSTLRTRVVESWRVILLWKRYVKKNRFNRWTRTKVVKSRQEHKRVSDQTKAKLWALVNSFSYFAPDRCSQESTARA